MCPKFRRCFYDRMEIAERRGERRGLSRPPSYLCISEGREYARVANERCNVSVSLAVGQDNDSRSIGGKNIPLSPLQGLSSAPLHMRYYARSSKEEICSISGPLNTGLFITRMGSAFLEIKRPRKQCHNCLIARNPAAGGLMTYGSSDPPSASCSEDGWKEK